MNIFYRRCVSNFFKKHHVLRVFSSKSEDSAYLWKNNVQSGPGLKEFMSVPQLLVNTDNIDFNDKNPYIERGKNCGSNQKGILLA